MKLQSNPAKLRAYMNRVEATFYNCIGIRPESDEIKWYSVTFFEIFAKLDKLIHRTHYEGVSLPTEGPAFVIGNHTSMWDIAKGYRVGRGSGRILRTYTRETLLDPTKKDSEAVLARTGHKSDILNSGPMWIRRLIAAMPRGVEARSVTRGGRRQDIDNFLASGKEIFNANQVAASFAQDTRNKGGRLVNLVRGVALLAKDNPDIPIYPMGISLGRPHRVSVGEPFTYNQMLQDPNSTAITRANFIVVIGDKIADQLNPDIKDDWYEVQRPNLLSRRKPSE